MYTCAVIFVLLIFLLLVVLFLQLLVSVITSSLSQTV